jgi:pimeloyl-ACP methyl ester carboxylesterase
MRMTTTYTFAPNTPRNIVLIHGLFLTWSSWERWVERYSARGFRVLPLAWPGLEGSVEELRRDPAPLKQLDIKKIVDRLEDQISALDSPPIIMGHSFGGLFAQILAYMGLGAAVVGIDPSAPAGVLTLPFSTLKSSAPILANPLSIGDATMLTPEQFHYAFTNTISEEESRKLYDRYAVPCANRVLFEGAFENFVPHSPARVDVKSDRAPILLIAGGADHLVTADYTRSNFKLIAQSPSLTAFKEFPGRPHFTAAVDGWEEVADYALEWALNPTATATVPVKDPEIVPELQIRPAVAGA